MSAPEYDSTTLVHELQTMCDTAVEWKMEQDYRLNELEAAATPPGLRPRVHTAIATQAEVLGATTTPPKLKPGVHVVVATPTAGGGPPVKAVEAEAAQLQPAPAGSLVERVAIVCDNPCNVTWDDQARAAIREVAATLRAQCFEHAANWLEKRAER